MRRRIHAPLAPCTSFILYTMCFHVPHSSYPRPPTHKYTHTNTHTNTQTHTRVCTLACSQRARAHTHKHKHTLIDGAHMYARVPTVLRHSCKACMESTAVTSTSTKGDDKYATSMRQVCMMGTARQDYGDRRHRRQEDAHSSYVTQHQVSRRIHVCE